MSWHLRPLLNSFAAYNGNEVTFKGGGEAKAPI